MIHRVYCAQNSNNNTANANKSYVAAVALTTLKKQKNDGKHTYAKRN